MRAQFQLFKLSSLLFALILLFIGSTSIALSQEDGDGLASGEWLTVTLNARNDLELLATAGLFTTSTRPDGWSGTFDINDPQFPMLVRLDLELLAGTLLGAETRPEGWFGASPSTMDAWSRDIRHDLELLADEIEGDDRPSDWVGGLPLMRCTRVTQAVVNLLERDGLYSLQADRTAANFCDQAELEVSIFIETSLLTEAVANASNPIGGGVGNVVNSNFAVGFLDRSAIQKAGVVPNGTIFTPVSRSSTQFSNMMLIRGDGFTVYVDYLFTNVEADRFALLPPSSGEASTSCIADWCEQ